MNRERFHYKVARILPWYVAMAGLAVFLILYPGPTTYFQFLKTFPGSLIRYGAAGVFIYYLFLHLPTFVRSVLRTPAVEYEGRVLLVRGWQDQSFDLNHIGKIVVRVDQQNEKFFVSTSGMKQACIPLRAIDGPASLVRFLQGLAAQGA
jgi:hypothetical protein